MLTISLPALNAFDNETQEFIQFPEAELRLEHSLRSISKWEGLRHESFFQDRQMSTEEFLDYIKCMTMNTVKDERIYLQVTDRHLQQIIAYISDPHTARKRPKQQKKPRFQEVQTAEDYYSAMAYFGIPFECENWHFGRLQALIDKCSGQAGGTGGKKMSFREQQMMFDEINEARLRKLHTKG